MSKSQTLTWNDIAEQSFYNVRDALANATMLHYPKVKCTDLDASDSAVGAVLQQYDQGTWQPIILLEEDAEHRETL